MKVWKIIVLLNPIFLRFPAFQKLGDVAMEVTEGSKLGDVTPAGQNI